MDHLRLTQPILSTDKLQRCQSENLYQKRELISAHISGKRQEGHSNIVGKDDTHTPQAPEMELFAEKYQQVGLNNECIQEINDS